MTCIVTGCALIDPANDRTVWGDLHLIAGAYVFNACLQGFEAAWEPTAPILDVTPSITINLLTAGDDYFERRGVIVFPRQCGTLNTAAHKRCAKWV